MKQHYTLFCAIFLCAFTAVAQSPFIWAREGVNPPNPTSNNEGEAVAVDPDGNVFATGYYTTSSTTFGPYTLNNPNGNAHMYLVKYDSSGTELWAATITGAQSSAGYALAADDSGNVYIAGRYTAAGTVSMPPLTFPSSAAPVFFLAKYDANGNALWVQRMGQQYFSSGRAVALDHAGAVYFAGYSPNDSVIFDTITVHSTYPGQQEIYLARFTTTGSAVWVRHFGSNDVSLASDLTVDTSGNVFLTGNFEGASMVIGNDTLINAAPGTQDFFVSRFTPNGTPVWSKRYGGTHFDISFAICADDFGHLFVGGGYTSTTIPLGPNSFTNVGSQDCFIAKMNSGDGTITWSDASGTADVDRIYSICTDSTGHIFFTGGFAIASVVSPNAFVTLDSTVLNVIAGSLDPVFIVEMDTTQDIVHSLVMQTGGDDMLAIRRDPASSAVYISGDARNNPWNIGIDTLYGGINSGEYIITAKLNLNNNGLYAPSAGVNGTDCNNPCSASATCNPSGGTPPYSYNWIPGNMNTPSVNNLCAGTYTVIVTDQMGDSDTNTVTVAYVSSGPTLTFSITPVSCFGDCDGGYVAIISGGTGPYSIFPFAVGTNLCPGNYPVTVTDMNACSFTGTAVITQPPVLSATLVVTDATCPTCADGSITCNTSGGTGSCTYNWQPGNMTTSTVNNLLPGTYTCCVTDANGCETCVVDSVLISIGLNETNQNSAQLFPNPVHDVLSVTLPVHSGSTQVRILSSTGQLLIEQSCIGNPTIDVAELAPGMYFLEVETQEAIIRSSFVKE